MEEQIVAVLEPKEAFKAICDINDGDCALLYAYIAASGGRCKLSDAALHTGFDDRRIERAKSLLILYKVCKQAGAIPTIGEISYTPAELLSAQRGDRAFSGMCDYLEQALGRSIRKSEIEILYGIYDRLNMPADVIMLLINYCRSRGRLSARELERKAYEWHDKGIVTYSAAADLADEMGRQSTDKARIMALFGMVGRNPSETEEKYISAWLEMGVGEELVKMAYDRTVLRTGRLQWRYLHKILEDWHKKGYKTREQIERAEGKTEESVSAAYKREPEESVVSVVTRVFEKKRQQREELQLRHLEELRRVSPEFAQNEVDLGRITVQKAKAGLGGGQADIAALEERQKALLQRRERILASLEKDESYISIPPLCSKCMDRGYIGNKMCECFKTACIEEEQRRKKLDVI
ncbi:MAG: DnaD domain protein [Clostridiaceae bacterium]|nr:DnaD domain protein [Clostridiaceae bacterium]